MLDKLREMTGGNAERMQRYISIYQASASESIEALQTARNREDLAQIRHVIHGVKPLFTVMGFEDLRSMANAVEVRIDTREVSETLLWSDVSDLVERMSRSLELLAAQEVSTHPHRADR